MSVYFFVIRKLNLNNSKKKIDNGII
jgi:hypothetical protein